MCKVKDIFAALVILLLVSIVYENSQAHNQRLSNIDTLENNLRDTQETLQSKIDTLNNINAQLETANSKIEQLEDELESLK